MDDWRVYIVNLGKYIEGEAKGAWFSVPVDIEDVKEKIGLNGEYEEYAIHDYELPFGVGEYESIERINNIYHQLENLNEDVLADLKDLMAAAFESIEELIENQSNLIFYQGIESLDDLVFKLVEEGCYGEISERLKIYIDYTAMARDLNIEGTYVTTDNGIWKVCM